MVLEHGPSFFKFVCSHALQHQVLLKNHLTPSCVLTMSTDSKLKPTTDITSFSVTLPSSIILVLIKCVYGCMPPFVLKTPFTFLIRPYSIHV